MVVHNFYTKAEARLQKSVGIEVVPGEQREHLRIGADDVLEIVVEQEGTVVDHGDTVAHVADLVEHVGAHQDGEVVVLLPQVLEEDDDPTDLTVDPISTTTDQKLVVSYTIKIKYASAAEWATEEAVSAVRLNNGTISSWQDNQRITYRISINPYNTLPITFDPAVVAWDNIESSDINLNQFDN